MKLSKRVTLHVARDPWKVRHTSRFLVCRGKYWSLYVTLFGWIVCIVRQPA